MEYGLVALMIIGGILLYIKVNELQKQVKSQQVQIDKLCKETGNQQLARYFVSDEGKEYIAHLKKSGKEVEAVKKAREVTSMDLVQAKQYIDTLLVSEKFLQKNNSSVWIYGIFKLPHLRKIQTT